MGIASEVKAAKRALDMAREARMARAKTQGYNVNRDWYHGTTKSFDKFDPSLSDPESWYGQGIYMSESPVDVEHNYATHQGPDNSNRVGTLYDSMRDSEADPEFLSEIAHNLEPHHIDNMTAGWNIEGDKNALRDNLDALKSADPYTDEGAKLLSDHADELTLAYANKTLLGDAPQTMKLHAKDANIFKETANYKPSAVNAILDGVREHASDYAHSSDEYRNIDDALNGIAVQAEEEGHLSGRRLSEELRNIEALQYLQNDEGKLMMSDVIGKGIASAGYAGVEMDASRFRNMPGTLRTKHRIMFNPDDVRSTTAAFDPANIGSGKIMGQVDPKLLAGMAATAGAVAAMTPDEANASIERAITRGTEVLGSMRGGKAALKTLTPTEIAKMRQDTAQKFMDLRKTLPTADEMAAVAKAGGAKKGWYRASTQAILDVFGPKDAPRFTALLAATSPQTSVESNLLNALNIWTNWDMAGRPTNPSDIKKIMGASVQGGRGEESVLPAWINNSMRALTTPNTADVMLSGPKVDSFMRNLNGVMHEVTNDAWMANYGGVDQTMFSGSITKTDPGKTPGYLAMSSKVREAADKLTKMTGEKWEPAEVQETIWSWAKTLYEKQNAENGLAPDILRLNNLPDAEIANTPDFGTLLTGDTEYADILRRAGYDTGPTTQPASAVTGSRTADAMGTPDEQHLMNAAERLAALKNSREAGYVDPALVGVAAPVLAGASKAASAKDRYSLLRDMRDAVSAVPSFAGAIAGGTLGEIRKGVGYLNPFESPQDTRQIGDQMGVDYGGQMMNALPQPTEGGNKMLDTISNSLGTLGQDLHRGHEHMMQNSAMYRAANDAYQNYVPDRLKGLLELAF